MCHRHGIDMTCSLYAHINEWQWANSSGKCPVMMTKHRSNLSSFCIRWGIGSSFKPEFS